MSPGLLESMRKFVKSTWQSCILGTILESDLSFCFSHPNWNQSFYRDLNNWTSYFIFPHLAFHFCLECTVNIVLKGTECMAWTICWSNSSRKDWTPFLWKKTCQCTAAVPWEWGRTLQTHPRKDRSVCSGRPATSAWRRVISYYCWRK